MEDRRAAQDPLLRLTLAEAQVALTALRTQRAAVTMLGVLLPEADATSYEVRVLMLLAKVNAYVAAMERAEQEGREVREELRAGMKRQAQTQEPPGEGAKETLDNGP